jgi:ABC-2 type transport system permease protein
MNKIFLIIKREYLSRVKKRSFLIMSILGPIIFAAFLVVPTWLASMEDKEEKIIAVIDNTSLTYGVLEETEYLKFVYLNNTEVDDVKSIFSESDYHAILFIPDNIISSNSPILYSENQTSLSTRKHITDALENEIERQKLKAQNIENLDEILQSVETKINLVSKIWDEDGKAKESSAELAMGVGYIGGFLIYFFIFLFGAMVMRGVIEEKTSRIVEVIISSVRPFQLMMGKIVGVGLVGLTQFLIWVILTLGIVTVAKSQFLPDIQNQQINTTQDIMSGTASDIPDAAVTPENMEFASEIFSKLDTVPFGLIIGMFLFYFLGGYLLYASFFAIIGSAVDNETDTQQFMLPVTVPLILGIFVMLNTIQNPEGPIAFWFSMIPLTSPIVMMVRVPFEPPVWQLALSAAILVLTFIGSVWMAGKIYRTGILMYGKKVNYKELWKWLRYKN